MIFLGIVNILLLAKSACSVDEQRKHHVKDTKQGNLLNDQPVRRSDYNTELMHHLHNLGVVDFDSFASPNTESVMYAPQFPTSEIAQYHDSVNHQILFIPPQHNYYPQHEEYQQIHQIVPKEVYAYTGTPNHNHQNDFSRPSVISHQNNLQGQYIYAHDNKALHQHQDVLGYNQKFIDAKEHFVDPFRDHQIDNFYLQYVNTEEQPYVMMEEKEIHYDQSKDPFYQPAIPYSHGRAADLTPQPLPRHVQQSSIQLQNNHLHNLLNNEIETKVYKSNFNPIQIPYSPQYRHDYPHESDKTPENEYTTVVASNNKPSADTFIDHKPLLMNYNNLNKKTKMVLPSNIINNSATTETTNQLQSNIKSQSRSQHSEQPQKQILYEKPNPPKTPLRQPNIMTISPIGQQLPFKYSNPQPFRTVNKSNHFKPTKPIQSNIFLSPGQKSYDSMQKQSNIQFQAVTTNPPADSINYQQTAAVQPHNNKLRTSSVEQSNRQMQPKSLLDSYTPSWIVIKNNNNNNQNGAERPHKQQNFSQGLTSHNEYNTIAYSVAQ